MGYIQKKIFVSVTNDLVTDNRVHKVCTSLQNNGYLVTLTGRRLSYSQEIGNRVYKTKRMNLLFHKGPLFYACFNIRLFFLLLFSKFDILLANDLDTLPANYLISILKKKPLVFDSHEYFTEVPELINHPFKKRIWKYFEKKIVPKVKKAYTVCHSIASLYQTEYNIAFQVIRNIPVKQESTEIPENFILNKNKKYIIYQGALNIDRGLPEAIEAMKYLEGIILLLVGDGDITIELKKLVKKLKLEEKVIFSGRLPFEQVWFYTMQAHLGLSIEKDIGLNYRFALPNKLFDYIHAGIPVLISNLPEMVHIVNHYNIGLITEYHDPKKLSEIMENAVLNQSQREIWIKNLLKAQKELTWENEEKELLKIFESL